MSNFVISFPKCGRTWLRVVMGKSVCLQYGLNDKNCLYLPKQPFLKPYPVFKHSITKDHKVHIASAESYKSLPKDITTYKGRKILFLVRNPLDVMVSYWCHRHYRNIKDPFKGDISQFIRTDYYGIDKLLYFWNLWNDEKGVLKKFKFITYENMHKNLLPLIRNVFDFFGMRGIQNHHINEAIEFSTFRNLKKKQKEQYFPDSEFRAHGTTEPEGQKIRKGKVKGYTDYLSQEDIDYVKERMEKMGCPFYKTEDI